MPDAFVVTTPTTAVALDTTRSGQVSFTVSNISGRPLRARLRPQAQEPTKAEWLTISGATERDFSLGATEIFIVNVTVPATVAAGTYSFRGDAVGEEEPDEDYAQGPTVALSVPAQPAKPKFPWWIVAAAAAVLVIGAVIFVVISSSGKSGGGRSPSPLPSGAAHVPVPKVDGLFLSAAETRMRQAGLGYTITVDPSLDKVPGCEGRVGSTNPPAGAPVPLGSKVTLNVSDHVTSPLVCAVLIRPSVIITR